MDIQDRADLAYGFFTKSERVNGDEFWKLKDNAPDWAHDLVKAAHENSNMSPDDFRYETIVEVLGSLAEGNDPDYPEVEADPRIAWLCDWMGSHGRYSYCDDAMKENGPFESVVDIMMAGQVREKEEIWYQVVEFLRDMPDDEWGDENE